MGVITVRNLGKVRIEGDTPTPEESRRIAALVNQKRAEAEKRSLPGIVDDIEITPSGECQLGSLAAFIRDRRIPLELCPTSNVHTGAVQSLKEHPIELLKKLGFRVTVNTDNRLMSDVSMTSELLALHEVFGWGIDDFSWLTVNSMKSAFLPFDERINLIENVIKPGWKNISSN